MIGMPVDNLYAKKVLAEALGLAVDSIPDEAGIDGLPAWDSLAHMRLIIHIEGIIGRSLEVEEILSVVDIEGLSKVLDASRLMQA